MGKYHDIKDAAGRLLEQIGAKVVGLEIAEDIAEGVKKAAEAIGRGLKKSRKPLEMELRRRQEPSKMLQKISQMQLTRLEALYKVPQRMLIMP
ncbi:hypothetical protein TWF718_007808 [Orbilia javanica]|uniref:Uncharacterized protein n=1 Tax=Orbilia javanica TaxID=47235 RepID=A0AAN8N3G6_9PEZI